MRRNQAMNAYEKLYTNTKSQFTVIDNNKEYTLGELMLMKANKKKEASKLPAVSVGTRSVTSFLSYVNEKLTVKNPPKQDVTIKRFPLRTACTAFLSALVMCSFVLSLGVFSGKNIASSSSSMQEPETYISESELNEENLEK